MTLNRFAAPSLLLALVLAPTVARAQFSTTNAQVLQGWDFDDNKLGYDATDGQMTTVTINHFSGWSHGDNFLFVDMYWLDAWGGYDSDVYAEWHPRLFLNTLGLPTGGIVKNWGLAGEVNVARGFYAYLGGLGLDLAIPGFSVAGLNLFYRYDNFADHTWQVSPYWTVPITLGPVALVFTGFLDVTTDADDKLDIIAQPQLLLDLGALAGVAGKLHAGIEWYLHQYRNFVDDEDKLVSAPQALVQWTIY